MLFQVSGDGGGEIRNDHVGAGAFDRGQNFEGRAFLVDPAVHAGGANHRIFAGQVVGSDRDIKLLLHAIDEVEVGQGGLDHHDVGAFLEVKRDLTHGLVTVGRIHLVGA